VERLYREKLFKGTDYTQSDDGKPVPRHLQFAYALIRPEMVPGEALTLSPEVQAAIDEKVTIMGMRLTPREVVRRFIKPRSTADTRASVRNPIARKALEPLYERLLKMDLDEWEPEDPQPGGGGGGTDGEPGGTGGESGEPGGEPTEPKEGEEPGGPGEPGTAGGKGEKKEGKSGRGPWMPFEKDHDTFNEQQSPDNISDKDREDYKEAKEKQAKEGENARREREATEQEKAWCERNDISPKQLARYRELQTAVAPHLRRLAALWDRIIGAAGRDSSMEMRGHFRAGALDVPEAIRQFPAIKSGNVRDIRVMKKMQEASAETDRPELIRVRLLCDQSGSMFSDAEGDETRHTAKMNALVHSVVLVLESLSLFQAKLNATRARTGSKLHVDTEVIRFGSHARHLKPLRTVSGKEEDLADAIRAVTAIDGASRGDGNTLDHQAMELVLGELDEKQRAKMRARKTVDLVIEITDGGSGDRESARTNLDELLEAGAVVRAVQAGTVHPGETAAFNHVWNDGRPAPLGEAIGGNVEKLADVLERLLAEHLGTVRA
jgi:hypothetical protein